MVLSAARRFWRYRTPNSAALVSCQSQMKKSPGRVDGLVGINAMALDAAIRGSIFAGPDCLRRENDRVALRLDAGVVTAHAIRVRPLCRKHLSASLPLQFFMTSIRLQPLSNANDPVVTAAPPSLRCNLPLIATSGIQSSQNSPHWHVPAGSNDRNPIA